MSWRPCRLAPLESNKSCHRVRLIRAPTRGRIHRCIDQCQTPPRCKQARSLSKSHIHKSPYATSYKWSIATLVIFCTVLEIRWLKGRKLPIHIPFRIVINSISAETSGSPSVKKIMFVLIQYTRVWHSDRHTDRRADISATALVKRHRRRRRGGRAGLRPNWAWCCCPEKGLFSFRHSRPTKKSKTPI